MKKAQAKEQKELERQQQLLDLQQLQQLQHAQLKQQMQSMQHYGVQAQQSYCAAYGGQYAGAAQVATATAIAPAAPYDPTVFTPYPPELKVVLCM